MESVNPKSKKGVKEFDRRFFLSRTGIIIKFSALFVLLLPLARFIGFNSPKKPKLVTINKVLKKDGFIIEPDFILFDINNKPFAVSRKCTHLGCRLNYHELEMMLICPCHRSRFSKDGRRIDGPARLDLPTFKVSTIGTAVVTGYVVAIL